MCYALSEYVLVALSQYVLVTLSQHALVTPSQYTPVALSQYVLVALSDGKYLCVYNLFYADGRCPEWNIRYLNHAGKGNGIYDISITQAKGMEYTISKSRRQKEWNIRHLNHVGKRKGIYNISITQAKEDDKVTEALEPLIDLVASEALFFRPQVVYNLLYALS
jgi:hypothetical protein